MSRSATSVGAEDGRHEMNDHRTPDQLVTGTEPGEPVRGWGMPWPGAEVAVTAEAAGCRAFCAGEFANRNAYVSTTEMALSTSSAMIGPGVAYAFTRSPFVHASALRQLSDLAPGRVFLGLGSGTRRMNRDWFAVDADRPLGRMADLIAAIKAYLAAPDMTPVRHAGEFYPIDADIRAPVLGPLDVPVVVGAFNRGMARVAGRVGDGVIGHGLFTDRWWAETIEPNLAAGAESVGRDASCLQRWGWVITSVDDDDPARAERDARLMIAFYLTVKTYDTLVELHGWEGAVAEIRRCFAGRDIDGMAAAVPDAMLDSIAVHGTVSEARDRLAERRNLPALRFHSPPSFMVSARRKSRYAASIIELMKELRT